MSPDEIENTTDRATEQPLVPTGSGSGLPTSLDPVITAAAVQRYLESERQRSRRSLLWVSAVFLLALLAILAVGALIGTVVIRNSSQALAVADRAEEAVRAYLAAFMGVSNRIANLESAHLQVRDEIKSWEDERLRDVDNWSSDLNRLREALVTSQASVSQALFAVQSRLSEMDTETVVSRRELAAIKNQYEALLAALTMPRAAMGSEGDGSKAGTPGRSRGEESPDQEVAALPEVGADAEMGVSMPTNEDIFAVEELPPVKPPPGPMQISVVTLPNGDRYEGQFKEGLFNGWGVYYYHNGDKYEGEFKDDMKHGRGTLIYRNGDRYVGEFANDMKCGKGSLLFANGDKYVGEFANDTMNGRGTLLYQNGNRYAGEFRNGLKHGNGVFRFTNGDVYSGEFKDDMRNGRGTYVSNSGAKYVGEFKDGKRHGKGRYIYPTGEEYSGEFKDGKKDGFGICTYPNGRILRGIWRNDKFVRIADG